MAAGKCQAWDPQLDFIKKETLAQVFSCEFCEISKNNTFIEHLWMTVSIHYFDENGIEPVFRFGTFVDSKALS